MNATKQGFALLEQSGLPSPFNIMDLSTACEAAIKTYRPPVGFYFAKQSDESDKAIQLISGICSVLTDKFGETMLTKEQLFRTEQAWSVLQQLKSFTFTGFQFVAMVVTMVIHITNWLSQAYGTIQMYIFILGSLYALVSKFVWTRKGVEKAVEKIQVLESNLVVANRQSLAVQASIRKSLSAVQAPLPKKRKPRKVKAPAKKPVKAKKAVKPKKKA
jgi:hypothetical protein